MDCYVTTIVGNMRKPETRRHLCLPLKSRRAAIDRDHAKLGNTYFCQIEQVDRTTTQGNYDGSTSRWNNDAVATLVAPDDRGAE